MATTETVKSKAEGWWIRYNNNDYWGMREVIGPAITVQGFVGCINSTREGDQLIESHANLIAAAPELLEALVFVLDVVERELEGQQNKAPWKGILKPARAAIAKATTLEST